LKDKLVIITGATSGIGKETARGLVRQGAHVVIVGRNPAKAEAAAEELRREGPGPVDNLLADFSSLEQTRGLAAQILEKYPRIDVLMSNAGVYRMRRKVTVDGYEETFAVNHLAPYLLINLLLDRLRASAPARIVVTGSDAHQGAQLDFDDLMLKKHYGHWRAYSRSKLANIMFTYALARRVDGSGVTANVVHPGFVASNLGSGNGIPVGPFMMALRPFVLSPEAGARTSIWVASSPELDGANGMYFSNSKIVSRANREHRSNHFSYDKDLQEQLWDESAKLVGLS